MLHTVHLGLDAAPAVISAPSLPNGSTEVARGIHCIVPMRWLRPWWVSTARASSDSSSIPIAPEPTFWITMLASIPLAFAFGLDPRAVDKEVQWALGTTIRQVHVQCLLTPAQCAEIRRRPIQTRQTQQALNYLRSPVARTSGAFTGSLCRSPISNSTFRVRHAWIAASLKLSCRPRLQFGGGTQTISRGRTKWTMIRAASTPCYTTASSWSFTLWVTNCSCPPAIMLDSPSESLKRFVQQSRWHDIARIDGKTPSRASRYLDCEDGRWKAGSTCTAAMANKTARVIWAMLTRQVNYRQPVT